MRQQGLCTIQQQGFGAAQQQGFGAAQQQGFGLFQQPGLGPREAQRAVASHIASGNTQSIPQAGQQATGQELLPSFASIFVPPRSYDGSSDEAGRTTISDTMQGSGSQPVIANTAPSTLTTVSEESNAGSKSADDLATDPEP